MNFGLDRFLCVPAVPQGRKHRVTTLGKCHGPLENPTEPRRTLEETSAGASENFSEAQISSESLAPNSTARTLPNICPTNSIQLGWSSYEQQMHVHISSTTSPLDSWCCKLTSTYSLQEDSNGRVVPLRWWPPKLEKLWELFSVIRNFLVRFLFCNPRDRLMQGFGLPLVPRRHSFCLLCAPWSWIVLEWCWKSPRSPGLTVPWCWKITFSRTLEPDPPSHHKVAWRTKRFTNSIFSWIRRFGPGKEREVQVKPWLPRTKFANLLDFALRWLVHSWVNPVRWCRFKKRHHVYHRSGNHYTIKSPTITVV